MAKLGNVLLASVTACVFVGVALVNAENAETKSSKSLVAAPFDSKVAAPMDSKDLAARSDLKVRYFDFFASMRECQEGVQEAEKLEAKRKELADGLLAETKKFEQAATKYQAEASTLNDSARAKKEQELAKMDRDRKSSLQSCEEEMKLVMQAITESLAKEIEEAVVQLAQEEGLDAVVDKQTGRVIYTSPKADFTYKVVNKVNKNYSVKLASNQKSAPKSTVVAANKPKASTAAAA
jgi:Skp family chaperone for outer membrane proteins